MKLTLTKINFEDYPDELRPFFCGAKIFDSSCSLQAKVLFVDKDGGYFLKSAPKGSLEREAAMTRYFHGKGLAAEVIFFSGENAPSSAKVASREGNFSSAKVVSVSQKRDFLLTKKIRGDDCIAKKHLEQPERLAEILGELLSRLHKMNYSDCPIQNHTEKFLERIYSNKCTDNFDKSNFPDSFGYASADEAWTVVEKHAHLLQTNTLLHGDFCLPNIILDDWKIGGFVDLDSSGVGDRHVDIFWGAWTLWFNLKTNKFRNMFFDSYGREKIDKEILRVVAACEVFG